MISVFSKELVTKSDTAIRLHIKEQEEPSEQVMQNAQFLYLSVLCKIPIDYYISSFWRCDKLNKILGGSPISGHKNGECADLDSTNNHNNKAIFEWIKDHCSFDQLIWEFGNDTAPDWVHVGTKQTGNRHQILKAIKQKGKTIYIPFT